jgi:hypothetical protein
MWVPRDAAAVGDPARAGEIEETTGFDAKADLPERKNNSTLAIDVAAMSTDGGVLLYGVAEDEHRRPTIPQPIALAGAADRVDQIVSTSIAEVPYIDVRELPCSDDPSRGYLLVIVPQSARAPHQVTVGADLRFYGRGAKGNRILTEGEVARLYRRREEWEQDRDTLLAEALEQAPFPAQTGLAYLHGFARPVAPDRTIWDRAIATEGDRGALEQLLAQAASEPGPNDGFAPNFKSGVHWTQQGADEWRMSSISDRDYSDPSLARFVVNVRLNIDGRGHLFCGRAGESINPAANAPDPHGRLILFESIIAGNLAAFLGFMGAFYRAGGFHGHVDVGVAVTSLRGGFSSTSVSRPFLFDEEHAYNADAYPRHERVAAAELDEPETVARRLLRHLLDAITKHDNFDPFA